MSYVLEKVLVQTCRKKGILGKGALKFKVYLFKDILCAYYVPGSKLDSRNTKMIKTFLASKGLRV